jgi:peroxiredoxin
VGTAAHLLLDQHGLNIRLLNDRQHQYFKMYGSQTKLANTV